MRTPITLCVTAVLALFATGCADPPPSKYPSQVVHTEDTSLGPGDVFEVRVYRQEEMSKPYSVSAEGTFSFPLIGTVKAEGLTPAELERVLTTRLADGFLKHPQVSVLVKERNSKKVSVFGQVRRPGTLPFADGMTVVEAISQAGGFTGMAWKNAVTVTRALKHKKKRYTIPVEKIGQGKARNFFVRPGDVVFVPQRTW